MTTDWNRLFKVSVLAAKSWEWHTDYEDILQEALIIAWQNRDTEHDMVRLVRWRLIDRIRSTDDKVQTVPLDVLPEVTYTDDRDPVTQYGLTDREAQIAHLVGGGFRQSETARLLNISGPRVRQVLDNMKETASA